MPRPAIVDQALTEGDIVAEGVESDSSCAPCRRALRYAVHALVAIVFALGSAFAEGTPAAIPTTPASAAPAQPVPIVSPAPTAKPRPKPELKVFPAHPEAAPAQPLQQQPPVWTTYTSPAAYLTNMGKRIKARWRQLYRQPPPTPATERSHAAFALGALLADSFLALQATDAQQYRNTGQDMVAYSRVLGIGERMSPLIMSQGKMAEEEKWDELTRDTEEGHQQFIRVLHEMRDGDLAHLVELGLWLRLIEISANMVSQVPEAKAYALAVGHPDLVRSLSAHYIQITARTQKNDRIVWVGEFIDYLQRHGQLGQEPDELGAIKVLEKVSSLMLKLTLK